MKNLSKIFMKELSKLGRAMLIPIVAMPVTGLLSRFGEADLLNLPVLKLASGVVFGNLDILFAIGAVAAYAKAKDKTCPILASILSLMIFKESLVFFNPDVNMGVFAGIIVGVVCAVIFNYSKEWKTPDMFAFFTGEKFVVTLAPIAIIIFGAIFSYVWPPIQNGLNSFAIWLGAAGALGVFCFGFFNRMLIPIGLHHVLNTYIYYELGTYTTATGEIVKGEIPRFLAGDPTAGLFLSMFFVSMMFGIPAICLAIYRKAKKNKKEEIKGAMTAGALTSFVTGITEPVEFSFMFVAPKLYLAHAILTGAAGAILYLLNVHFGIAFGFCIIDFVLNWNLATNAYWIIIIGVIMFAVYYFVFTWIIEHDNVKTPGREDEIEFGEEVSEEEKNIQLTHSNYAYMAKKILQSIGGKENIESVENCVTRLRFELHDGSLVNEENIKKTGAKGVIKLSPTSIQIIIGTEVRKVKKELDLLMKD